MAKVGLYKTARKAKQGDVHSASKQAAKQGDVHSASQRGSKADQTSPCLATSQTSPCFAIRPQLLGDDGDRPL